MKVLVFGGTGAIGVPLVQLLENAGHDVYITSRNKRKSYEKTHYIAGNARDNSFLKMLLTEKYDAIVDFMVYASSEFEVRLPLLLRNTEQYIFFSSSRVYAESVTRITEESPRILDICEDAEYLKTDEYALSKAREEDLLQSSREHNWTIIRPYITYNEQRLQLGAYEKENWLYRALRGRTIVLPQDIMERTTSLTFGPDVAKVLYKLIGETEAFGQAFHIVSTEYTTWQQILNLYLDILENRTGKRPKVLLVDSSEGLQKIWNCAQIRFDRLFDRSFDSSKVIKVCGDMNFKLLENGIEECLNAFLDHPKWLDMNWKYEAWADRCASERTEIKEILGKKAKLKYVLWRYLSG